MTTRAPVLVSARALSDGWGQVFLRTMRATPGTLEPIVLTIHSDGGIPPENPTIRQAVDQNLRAAGCNSVATTALTIFPYAMWTRRGRPDVATFSKLCVERLLPRLRRRDSRNQYGTYFGRMMSYSGARNNTVSIVNQLAFVIRLLNNKARRPRQSALQLVCFDPAKDHTGQPVRGFPCLQQVSISYSNDNSLAVTALYPTQYIFERAYGNYLGLCHLGEFIAHQTNMRFVRLTCMIEQPTLGNMSKSSLRSLESIAREQLDADGVDHA